MATKRKTLPKDFEELLSKNDIQELKKVFNKCEIDARGDFYKQTALAFDNCPHELAKWLVEQGADLQATDSYGNTPLHRRSSSRQGNIKSLLELGADINAESRSAGTPLHAAARSHQVDNTRLLLAQGANMNALNSDGHTPLEHALRTCRNIDIESTVELSKIYLGAGAKIVSGMKEQVLEIGKKFEFMRARFNKESVDTVSNALEELYKLFDVEPVARRVMHDGKSPITTSKESWQEQHQELWDLLVPSSGPAATVQGEVIRISGRIANELDGNGGVNWDGEFKKMADAFVAFVQQGNPLSSSELAETQQIVNEIKRRSGNPGRMCELGVKWVVNNPVPFPLPPVKYER
ncbi:MAG: ankyrin repeat domain-containing protein [Bacteroidetes bacterium]|nr:ankyrin repeat domain-containing protein [Bacteroidota bacterium]